MQVGEKTFHDNTRIVFSCLTLAAMHTEIMNYCFSMHIYVPGVWFGIFLDLIVSNLLPSLLTLNGTWLTGANLLVSL